MSKYISIFFLTLMVSVIFFFIFSNLFDGGPNIENDLIDYVDAIYVDLLYEVLNLHSEKRLIEKLGTVNFDKYSFKQN